MNWKWIKPLNEPHERAGTRGQDRLEKYLRARSPYSEQYETIMAQGNERPTPSFWAPTLVWHVGVWPRPAGPLTQESRETCDPHDTAGNEHEVARRKFEERRYAWIEEINVCLAALEASGRWRRSEDGSASPSASCRTRNPRPICASGSRPTASIRASSA
jgi:hypothetical protein